MEDRKTVIKENTYLRDLSVFEKDLFPVLGDIPIDQLKAKMFLPVLKRLKHGVPQEMAKRSIPLCGSYFSFCNTKRDYRE